MDTVYDQRAYSWFRRQLHQSRDIYKLNLLTTVSIKNRADANCYTYSVMFIVIKLFYTCIVYRWSRAQTV